MLAALLLTATAGCAPRPAVLTFSGSVLGTEGAIVSRQIERFRTLNPDLPVEVRVTPDSADTRHQLYVQWLNAWSSNPDVLQLDVVWTPEFAAAGWILPLDDLVDAGDFFDAPLAANRWAGRLYAIPWFVDVGMLYWRTDLMDAPPDTFDALFQTAARARESGAVEYGFVWQGARYEGLVTVFLEHLAGHGGRILDDSGNVVVDSPEAVRALTVMRDAIESGDVPRAVLNWQEEPVRFAFGTGRAAFMRNWPYAAALAATAPDSAVTGRFGVAPMPHAPGGVSAAALGGASLAINARTEQPEAARALVAYLTAPEQMAERARAAGQFPARRSLYDDGELDGAFPVPPDEVRRIVEHAIARPATPVYTELSSILQVHLHRALTGQTQPEPALREAAEAMRGVLNRSGLSSNATEVDPR